MAFKTGVRGQAGGMAVVAGRPVMVHTVTFAAIAGGMWQVECGRAPGSGGVALVAGHGCEKAGVVGWVRVTGDTGGGQCGKDSCGVALCTGKPGMCSGQRELCQGMVECGGGPPGGGVTGAAAGAELTFMRVVLCMAAGAILRGCFHVCNCAGAGMAASAVQPSVFPRELEGDIGVVEEVTICVDPIVAPQAVGTISCKVRLHEISLDLLVAGSANRLVEFGITVYVTGLACKR